MTITISGLAIPTGKTIGETVDITFTTSSVIVNGAVTLYKSGIPIRATVAVPNGTSNTARFGAGTLAEDTYDVEIIVRDASDFGFDSGSTLTIEDTERAFTTFVELIRSTLRDSAIVDVNDLDILIDNFEHRKADDRNPGIVIQRGPYSSSYKTVAKKWFDFEVGVLVSTKANWRGERDDPDRRVVEEIADSVQRALEANELLGGFLVVPLRFSDVFPVLTRNLNDSSFYHVLTIQGSAVRLTC